MDRLEDSCMVPAGDRGLSDLRSPAKPQSSTAGAGNPVRQRSKVQTSLSRGFQGTWEELWEAQGIPGQWQSVEG